MNLRSVSEPVITRHTDGPHPTYSLQLPDPCAPFYPVSVEVIREYVDRLNELEALRAVSSSLDPAGTAPVPSNETGRA